MIVTFPYWPDSVAHPLVDVTFRMLGEDLVAPNLGRVCGIDGVLGIVPVLLVVAGVLGWTIQRAAGWVGLAMAAVVGSLVLVGYGLLPHGGPNARVASIVVVVLALAACGGKKQKVFEDAGAGGSGSSAGTSTGSGSVQVAAAFSVTGTSVSWPPRTTEIMACSPGRWRSVCPSSPRRPR